MRCDPQRRPGGNSPRGLSFADTAWGVNVQLAPLAAKTKQSASRVVQKAGHAESHCGGLAQLANHRPSPQG